VKIEGYNKMVELIEKMRLPSALSDKPLLTVGIFLSIAYWFLETDPFGQGNDICKLLDIKSGGPWLGAMLTRIIDWQLEHPGGTKSEVAAWIVDKVANGEIALPAEDDRPTGGERERKRARVEMPKVED
jgi:tRNA nucleotidyltransferase (CCA-adding enzyme)